MKQKTRWHDALVLAAVLCAAFLIVTCCVPVTMRKAAGSMALHRWCLFWQFF